MIKLLFLGEIVGLPAVKSIQKNLKTIKEKYNIDFTIANAEGASDGYGLLLKTALQIHKSGIDIITSGDLIYNKKDARDLLKLPFVLRPFNLPNAIGGKGYYVFNINDKYKIGVINILGRINFLKIFPSDPFNSVLKAIEKISESTNIIIVDFHGGATSEIQTMQWHLAGKVSLVAGTNLKVLTSDYRIINNKTAVITGLGFCGGQNSIAGFYPKIEINKIKSGQFQYSKVSDENLMIQGITVEINEITGDAVSINFIKEKLE